MQLAAPSELPSPCGQHKERTTQGKSEALNIQLEIHLLLSTPLLAALSHHGPLWEGTLILFGGRVRI